MELLFTAAETATAPVTSPSSPRFLSHRKTVQVPLLHVLVHLPPGLLRTRPLLLPFLLLLGRTSGGGRC